MKTQAVLFSAPGVVETCTVDVPDLGPRQIMTETLVSTISPGTEIRMLAGHYGAAGKFPYVPGYNAISRIVEVGSEAREWRVGDLVSTINPQAFPGITCLYGGHSKIQVHALDIDQRPIPLPEIADPTLYALVEIGAISLRGVLAADPKPGESAVVIGQGLIGLLSAAWLISRGCRVSVADLSPERLARSMAIGADFAIRADEAGVKDRLLAHSRGGFDIVVEASGSAPGAELACQLIRQTPPMARGQYVREPIVTYTGSWPRLVFQANYLVPFAFNPHSSLRGEGAIVIASGDRGVDERLRCAQGLRDGTIPVSKIVDQVFPWDQAPAAYEQLSALTIQCAVLNWT
jgi:2-desacetyl-2-hydroxyethyl bacteriochlorophyllide A dehydrogenase